MTSVIEDFDPNPIEQFKKWYAAAQMSGLVEPDAMALSTATRAGRPSSRVVLLKKIEDDALVFYTNYESRKGRELIENPFAALAFYWAPLDRQIRVEGRVEKVSRAESEAYFKTRPRESQLGAWASKQSTEIADRALLETSYSELRAKYDKREVPCPPHWGGFRVRVERMEFWIAREGRLHERTVYLPEGGGWRRAILSP